MNRRNFIKSCAVITAGTPFISMASSQQKRGPNSLFTIDELRTWCEMNGHHYIEDDDIKIRNIGGVKCKVIERSPTNRRLLCSRTFLGRRDEFAMSIKDQLYDYLRWEAWDYHIEYEHFYLYDIMDTTQSSQKEKGEFWSSIRSARFAFQDPYKDSHPGMKERMKEFDRVYCIKEKCWYKPVLNTNHDWWYAYNMVKV